MQRRSTRTLLTHPILQPRNSDTKPRAVAVELRPTLLPLLINPHSFHHLLPSSLMLLLSRNLLFLSRNQLPFISPKPYLSKQPLFFFFSKMASESQPFPRQHQPTQPGQEHVMNPTPDPLHPHYKPADKLLGKTALITGGDSGIGRAVCLHFSLEGASVAFTYVDSEEGKDAQDTLQLLHQLKTPTAKPPIAIPLDAGFESNCEKAVASAASHFGGAIDVLVNNAAEQHVAHDIAEITEQQLERVFRTNFFSYFYMTKFALKHMGEGGSIINTTSVNAYKGNKKLLDYTATKGAIVAFTRGLALQVVEKGIRVNGVAPGPVWTPLIPASFEEEHVANFGKEVPMKRAGQPEEIAPSYVFLACRDSSYITGQVIHPNGGTIVNA